jgi:hypothetical protein
MNTVLKAILRGTAAAAAVQGLAVPLLTSEGVTAKWISGIFGAIGLLGLVAEVGIDTLNQGAATTPTPAKPAA